MQTLIALNQQDRDRKMRDVVKVPVSRYTAPDILAEGSTVFRRYPLVAGHVASARHPGELATSQEMRSASRLPGIAFFHGLLNLMVQ